MDSFYDRIYSGEFDNPIPFPMARTGEAFRAYVEGRAWNVEPDILVDVQKLRREAEARFKSELLKELGLLLHPKADRLYELAWDRGHAYGYVEVYQAALEIADLLR